MWVLFQATCTTVSTTDVRAKFGTDRSMHDASFGFDAMDYAPKLRKKVANSRATDYKSNGSIL